MVGMTIQSQVCARESNERKAWTSEARNDVVVFLAQLLGVVCAAIFLYSLGPAFGITLIGVSLAAWSYLRARTASTELEDGPGEDNRHDATVKSPSDLANSAWLRNSGTSSSVSTARPVMRQRA